MKRFLPLFLCLLLSSGAMAQLMMPPDKCYRFFYAPGKTGLAPTDVALLRRLADSVGKSVNLYWVISGHADHSGAESRNEELARERAERIRALLLGAGVLPEQVRIDAYGSSQPEVRGESDSARDRNRRAQLCFHRVIDLNQPTIQELYRKIQTDADSFLVDPRRDTVLRSRRGTLIQVKAGTFPRTRNCGTGAARVVLREAYSASDAVRNNLSTMADTILLETGGMLELQAIDCIGATVAPQKDLVVFVPTDTIRADAQLFDGARLPHNEAMNWAISNDPRLSALSPEDVGYCHYWFACRGMQRPECGSCPFFFCGIGRGVGSLFSKRARRQLQEARTCPQRQVAYDSSIARATRAAQASGAALPSTRQPRCQELADLFRKYGVTDYDALLLALNKPLMDSLRVTTLAALRDTLEKIKIGRIEAAYNYGSIAYEDLKYYVFATRRLGWSNVDCILDLTRRQTATLHVLLRADPQTDCKIVFRARKAIFTPTVDDKGYVCKGLPKGEQATIVALRYVEGKAYLALQDIVIGNDSYTPEFREYSLEELKKELQRLDEAPLR